jgi:hypothetical protein
MTSEEFASLAKSFAGNPPQISKWEMRLCKTGARQTPVRGEFA